MSWWLIGAIMFFGGCLVLGVARTVYEEWRYRKTVRELEAVRRGY